MSHPPFIISHHCSYHITSTEFMTSHTLYMTSHTRQHKCYICHLTHYIWHYIHCICVINPSVSNIPHPLTWRHHTLYRYDIVFSMHDITWTFYDKTPLYVWHHTQYLYDIISNIYDITNTAFMTTQHLCLTSHPLYLTSQPLYLCHHTDGTHICIDVSLYRWHHNKYGSHHTWHTYDIIQTLHDITFTLYDSNAQYLWHHKHYFHDIRSPLYDITPMVYDFLSPIPVTSEPLYL